MDIATTIEKHKNQPNITLDEYVREKRIELAKRVLLKKSVYLDTKFWIILRDAALNRNSTAHAKNLLEMYAPE